MKISELQYSSPEEHAKTLMAVFVEKSRLQAKTLHDNWLREQANNPDVPHPALTLADEIDEMLHASR